MQLRWEGGGSDVTVAGSWNAWRPIPLRHDTAAGGWVLDVDAEPGTELLFKFIVDGCWVASDKYPTAADEYGGRNNVLVMEEGGQSETVVAPVVVPQILQNEPCPEAEVSSAAVPAHTIQSAEAEVPPIKASEVIETDSETGPPSGEKKDGDGPPCVIM